MTNTDRGSMWKDKFVKALKDKGIKVISSEEKAKLKSDVENKSRCILAKRKKTKFQLNLTHIIYLSVYYLTNLLLFGGLVVGLALLLVPSWLPESFKQIYSEYFVWDIWWLSTFGMVIIATFLYMKTKHFQREHRKYLWRRFDSFIAYYPKEADDIVNITRTEYEKLFGSTYDLGFFQERLGKNSFLCVEVSVLGFYLSEDKEIFTLDFVRSVSEYELVGDHESRVMN